MKKWRQIFREDHGTEIAEMAVVLPVMFLVFLGVFWAGRAYNIYATANQAAREGARVAATSTCASCGDTGGTDTAVDTAVTASLQADHLDNTRVTAPSPAPTTANCPGLTATCTSTTHNVSVCRNVLLTPAGVTPQECGVLVEFTYPIDVLAGFSIPYGGTLPNAQIAARGQMRVEQ